MMVVELYEVIRDFLNTGGGVLTVILLTTFLLWCLIVERFYFFKYIFPNYASDIIKSWQDRDDHHSWYAQRIREYRISQASRRLNATIPFIKTLVAVCPLLGLLGTVTGMISVFDVMSVTGTGNARLMASGISMATIPTMAGMVAALSGLYFGTLLQGRAKKEQKSLSDSLLFTENVKESVGGNQ